MADMTAEVLSQLQPFCNLPSKQIPPLISIAKLFNWNWVTDY